MSDIQQRATNALQALPRVSQLPSAYSANYGETSLLLPMTADLEYTVRDTVRTHGLGEALDSSEKELVSIIRILDPLNAKFEDLGIITPRNYVHSLSEGAPHVVAQAIVYFGWDEQSAHEVSALNAHYQYGIRPGDQLWQSTTSLKDVSPGAICLVMNRRVGGWDGSPQRPVVELLAGGGHAKTIWVDSSGEFQMQSVMQTLCQELDEELGFGVRADELSVLGGFQNHVTNELVVLAALRIEPASLAPMQEHAYGNLGENVDGLYLGLFDEIMRAYQDDASYFAGGERSKPTNFPSDAPLMKAIKARFNIPE
jgi:hypothetical protein